MSSPSPAPAAGPRVMRWRRRLAEADAGCSLERDAGDGATARRNSRVFAPRGSWIAATPRRSRDEHHEVVQVPVQDARASELRQVFPSRSAARDCSSIDSGYAGPGSASDALGRHERSGGAASAGRCRRPRRPRQARQPALGGLTAVISGTRPPPRPSRRPSASARAFRCLRPSRALNSHCEPGKPRSTSVRIALPATMAAARPRPASSATVMRNSASPAVCRSPVCQRRRFASARAGRDAQHMAYWWPNWWKAFG